MWPANGMLLLKLVSLLVVTMATVLAHDEKKENGVIYDSRSLIINGQRELLFSGSVHYPRSTPEMWPNIISKAKRGGLNCIQTYVFWNAHEPLEGQYNFEGRNDLVKFIKTAWEQGMYVTLRIGPFIQAEWNYGGLPFWLREVPGIIFRTNNEPYKHHMKKFTEMIIDMMKKEKLFAPQGGPIILAQIENEYDTIKRAFKEQGAAYIQWAGNMAVATNIGVPWVMCKQKDAPGPVVNACNGRNCGDTFDGPNHPTKPLLWTENWTQQFRVFGDPPSQRAAEDIAYSVARFFSKNGTLANYYMYHGGTNFGRTAAAFVTTRYYDEAPLDEYGLEKEPKYSHLKDLHHALRLCKKPLFWGSYSSKHIGKRQQAIVYENADSNVCAAFLANNDKRLEKTIDFRGGKYFLPPHSVSILPDCKNVVFNTQQITAQHNARSYSVAKKSNNNWEWQMHKEHIPKINHCPEKVRGMVTHMNVTEDKTDYLWYVTSLTIDSDDLPWRRDIVPILRVHSLGHALHAFVNDVYIGSGHGDKIEKSFSFKKPVEPLKIGVNHIQLLAMTIGFPDSGVYLEHRLSGVRFVSVQGLNAGTLDLSEYDWGHKAGLHGESAGFFTQEGSEKVAWSSAKGSEGQQLLWYKAYFDAPKGDEPVVIDLSSMAKGHVWVNGQSIGRYWVSFLNPLGQPSQTTYHIPRSFLKPTKNLVVIFEETGGKPEGITILTVNRDTICSFVSEMHPPDSKSWAVKNNKVQAVRDLLKPGVQLKCPNNKVISEVEFASFGDPTGVCGNYTVGKCNYPEAKNIVEQNCLGKTTCYFPIQVENFGGDKCPGVTKVLAAQVKCTSKKK